MWLIYGVDAEAVLGIAWRGEGFVKSFSRGSIPLVSTTAQRYNLIDKTFSATKHSGEIWSALLVVPCLFLFRFFIIILLVKSLLAQLIEYLGMFRVILFRELLILVGSYDFSFEEIHDNPWNSG